MDEVRIDRVNKGTKPKDKPGKSNLVTRGRASDTDSQGYIANRVVGAKVTNSEQSAWDQAILLMFIMCNVAFNSPWFKRVVKSTPRI